MSKSSFQNILSSSVWGILAKLFDAAAKFITIPLLVTFYGKLDYGLIALTFSLNAYMQLMDMGLNIGSIRFFSVWINEKKWGKIVSVSRSSIVFYGAIGLINSIIFLVISYFSEYLFNLSATQVPIFKQMMLILSISTVVSWMSNVVSQLLSAHGEQGWINKVTIITSLLNFLSAVLAVQLQLDISIYFALYIISTIITLPINIYKLKVYNIPIKDLLSPKWNRSAFGEILNYSLALFAMSIFQFSANNLRPLLLAKFSEKGVEILTEYRVLQTIAMLIIAIGGVFMQTLLPSASQVYAEQNTKKIEKLVYEGTKYISIFLSFVCFLIITNSSDILGIYMGQSFQHLYIWLNIWLLTILLSMHNAPVASIVLSSGKTRFLVYSSAISCIISLPLTSILVQYYEIGSAVLGYLVYVSIQILGYYLYYIPKVLKLRSSKIFFQSFGTTAIAGLLSYIGAKVSVDFIKQSNEIYRIILSSSIFSVIYTTLTSSFVLESSDIQYLKEKYLNS